MTDEFERRLRNSFRRAELPLAPESLRATLVGLPALERPQPRVRPAMSVNLLRMAAVLAVLAVTLGVFAFGYSSWLPAVDPSPSPSLSPTTSPSPASSPTAAPTDAPGEPLPEPAGLLAGYPEATLVYEEVVGPATEPRSDDPTIQRIEFAERPVFSGQFVLAGACIGPGELQVEARLHNQPSPHNEPWPGLLVSCDGHTSSFEHSSPLDDRSLDIQLVAVSVARGASWRFAVGQLPAPTHVPPEFERVEPTEGWWPLWGATGMGEPVTGPDGSGLGVVVPNEVTMVAVVVQCVPAEEDVELTFTVEHGGTTTPEHEDLQQVIPCTSGAGERIEFPVSAAEEIIVKAIPDRLAWLQLYMEGDAEPTTVYGPPPENLPAELAEAPYFEVGGLYTGFGTLGSERQRLLYAPGAPPALVPAGDFVALNRHTPTETTLELFSISEGAIVRRLASEPATRWIRATWVDLEHEQVFYLLSNRAGGAATTLERVAFDGTGSRTLAGQPASDTGFVWAELALDSSVFILDSCEAPAHCHRQLVDAATLELTSIDLPQAEEQCGLRGGSDGTVVVELGFSCNAFGPDATVVQALDGSELARYDDVRSALLVRTSEGLALVHRPSPQNREYQLILLESGERRLVDPGEDQMFLSQSVSLPPDWVLFQQGSLGDFPRHPLLRLGQPPRLVNVTTGEIIELTNLPHDR